MTTEDNVNQVLSTVPGKTQVLKKFYGINEFIYSKKFF